MTDVLIGLCWLYGRSESPPPPLMSALRHQGSTGPLNISSLPAAGQDVAAGVPALYCLKY